MNQVAASPQAPLPPANEVASMTEPDGLPGRAACADRALLVVPAVVAVIRVSATHASASVDASKPRQAIPLRNSYNA